MEAPLDVIARLALIAFPFLLAIVAWFVQRSVTKAETQSAADALERQRLERELRAELNREVAARLVDVETARQEIARQRERVTELQREVDKDYVNFERLDAVIRPLQQAFDNLSRDLRDGQRELFTRVDGKQDKEH